MDMIQHKVGDSIEWAVELPMEFPDNHFDGYTVTSQIRRSDGLLLGDFVVSWESPATKRTLILTRLDTSNWPTCKAMFDIQFVRNTDSFKVSSETTYFMLVKEVTTP